jgi:hypothetical protein
MLTALSVLIGQLSETCGFSFRISAMPGVTQLTWLFEVSVVSFFYSLVRSKACNISGSAFCSTPSYVTISLAVTLRSCAPCIRWWWFMVDRYEADRRSHCCHLWSLPPNITHCWHPWRNLHRQDEVDQRCLQSKCNHSTLAWRCVIYSRFVAVDYGEGLVGVR